MSGTSIFFGPSDFETALEISGKFITRQGILYLWKILVPFEFIDSKIDEPLTPLKYCLGNISEKLPEQWVRAQNLGREFRLE